MKYEYFYQTRQNENRTGWIKARNRAEAYASLRKQGIRPYRVVGDDPVEWGPWALGGLVAILSFALVWALFFRALPQTADDGLTIGAEPEAGAPAKRTQITGDIAVIASGEANGWEEVFPLHLDRILAAYAQPGRTDIIPPEAEEKDFQRLLVDLALPPCEAAPGDSSEVVHMKRIVAQMREEMKSSLAASESPDLKGYLDFLAARRNEEIAFREEALAALERAPEALREETRTDINARLRERGLPELK